MSIRPSERRNGIVAFNVHHTFAASLSDVACAIFVGGFDREWNRGQAEFAVRALFNSYGVSVPEKWRAATDDQVERAMTIAAQCFPELNRGADSLEAYRHGR